MQPQSETFQARAPRSRLEQLSRCGSDLRGEAAVEIVGDLAIGNPEGISRTWANIAFVTATHRQTSLEVIHGLAVSVFSDVLDRMRYAVSVQARKRKDVLLDALYGEISSLAQGTPRLGTIKSRAKALKIRDAHLGLIESEVGAIVNDRITNAAGNMKRDWR